MRRGEDGAVVLVVAIAMIALLGGAALAVDLGDAYLHKRRLRGATDLAVLAGAQKLPASETAESDAESFTTTNWEKQDSSTVTAVATAMCQSSGCSYPDKLVLETDAASDAAFAKLFDVESFPMHARAVAYLNSYTGFGANVMPFAVLEAAKTPEHYETPFDLKAAPGSGFNSGNYGPIDLSTRQSGACEIQSGASTYRDTIAGSIGECEMHVGDVFKTEPGQMNGPTASGLATRTVNGEQIVNPLDPNTLLTDDPATGAKMLTTVSHPNVILIPTIASWPGGSADITITGFVWFLITEYNGATISGIFVRTAVATSALQCYQGSPAVAHTCATGAYDPAGDAVGGTRVLSLAE